ncbi:MAG TPA: ATP-binding protein [Ramlibacter sp.]|jgi:signal transduction histidine kinase|nr:ATP-binding protein [Ramlibacter sp.]
MRRASRQSGFLHLPHGLRPDLAATSLRSLRIFMAACVAVALLLFGAFAAYRYQQMHQEAEVRLQRTLSIAHEHALRVLDTNETLLRHAMALVRDDDDGRIAAQSAVLHAQMREITAGKPQIQSIWVQGPDGRPLVSSRMAEPPADMNVANRPYFVWHREKRGGVAMSSLMRMGDERFFNISRGRYRSNGDFAGVVSVGLYASYFRSFHAQLAADEPGVAVTMFRNDGVVYSRWPDLPNQPERMSPKGEVLSRVLRGENAGVIRSVSSLDNQNRVILFQRLGEYPVYIGIGRELRVIDAAWMREMARVAAFVMVPVLLLVLTAYLVLRRTREALDAVRRLQEESAARRQVEEALLQAQKLEALGRLTGGVAHDFNNALMVISGNVHLLRKQHPELPQKYADAISRAVDSATKLTRQLLAFSRRQPLKPEVIALQERLPMLRDLLQPTLGSRVQLTIEVDPATPAVCVDPAELELALINLAVNARDAMPDGGSFRLAAGRRTGAAGPMVWIEAADTGEGMPPEVAARAFDPFFTTKPLGKGTGLGLGQVQALCRRAGGDIALESTLGKGTRVTLQFPASPLLPDPPGRAGEEQPPLGRSVLLVEDNAEVAAVIVPVLEKLGCEVVHQPSADAALQWLAQQHGEVDVLLTDVVMPGSQDGLGLAKAVAHRYPAVKLLVMTGYAEQIDVIGRLGYPVLPKPFSPQALADALRQVSGASPLAA